MAKSKRHVKAALKANEHRDDWDISEVLADLPHEVEIGQHGSKKALKIKIWTGQGDGKVHVGTLHIGKGGVQWTFGKKKYPRLNWHQFADKMTS